MENNYYGFYYKEDTGFYKGKQFCVVGFGPEYQKSEKIWRDCADSKHGLFEKLKCPVSKDKVIWVDDDFTNN